MLPRTVSMILLMPLSPETPRYLLLKGNSHQAKQSLCHLRKLPPDDYGITAELEEVNRKLEEDIEQANSSWSDFKRPNLYKPLVISLSLMVFQQFCGINAVIFYTESIFQTAGYKGIPGVPSVTIAAAKVGATCFFNWPDGQNRKKKIIPNWGKSHDDQLFKLWLLLLLFWYICNVAMYFKFQTYLFP